MAGENDQIVPVDPETVNNWDHPDWWVLLSLDGFTSNVNLLNAHEIFAEFKTMVIKEEGDTSHVCQAYDKQVAKYDKTHMHAALNMLNPVLSQSMDQWYLIDIATNAHNFIKKESWIESFKKVNIHPHTRSTFDVWIRKLDDCGFISAKNFFENRTTIYDAMPAFWNNLMLTRANQSWELFAMLIILHPRIKMFGGRKNLLSLAIFVRLEDVFKMNTCYLTSKLYPSVIVSLEEEESSNS